MASKPKKTPTVPEEAPAAYTVMARRYRPQQFADLVGQEAIAQALVNAVQSQRVAHAYLFTGARGVGKTSTARILAKALNCLSGPTPRPCDACDICLSIATGEDVDVLEIDGASNNKVEEVRDLRSNVQYRPARARFKIYIIDEVHMLSTSAFNALLKTLEEPPPHVKFIFATTEVQKIPITILSRCQRFDFGGISPARISARLRQIAAAEKVQADEEALDLIARRAAGSMRDGQSLLDQLLAFGGERLTVDLVHQLLGTAQDERILALAAAVLEGDPKRALEVLGQATDEGVQLGELIDQLLAYWRDLMVLHCAGPEGRDLSVAPGQRATLNRQAAALSLDTILAGLDILSATKQRLRGSHHGRLLLEMALVRLGRLENLVSLTRMAQWLSNPRLPGPGPQRASTPAPSPAPPPASSSHPETLKKKLTDPSENLLTSSPLPLTEQTLPTIWNLLLTQVAPFLARHLGKADPPAISGPLTLVLRFGPGYNLEREYCQEPARAKLCEEVLSTITGQPCQLRIEVSRSSAVSIPAESAGSDTASTNRSRWKRAETVQEPLLRRAVELLGAQAVHVDDGFGAASSVETEPAPELEET